MWIPKGVVLIRGRRLLEEIQHLQIKVFTTHSISKLLMINLSAILIPVTKPEKYVFLISFFHYVAIYLICSLRFIVFCVFRSL